MPLTSDEATFVAGVAKGTGLDPRVVVAWAQQEGAYAPGGTGGHNYLNLRPYNPNKGGATDDVGVVGISAGNFDQFGTVQDAINSTVHRLRQPFARSIIASAGQPPESEIAAIAGSGWDAAHYGGAGGPNLRSTFTSIFGGGALGSYVPPGPSGGLDIASSAGTGSAAGAGSADLGTVGEGVGWAATHGAVDIPGAGHIPGVQQIRDVAGAIDSVPKLISFLTSWRFAEIVGGVLLLLLGLLLLGRQFGVSPPLPGPLSAATATPGPIASQPRRVQRRAGFTLPADQKPPRRSNPNAQSDEIPF